MKSQGRGLWVSLVFSFLILAHPAQANPEGGTVVGGAARIDRLPGRLTINQGSDRLIINWRSFSIGAGETTKFVQPSASSAALNRVMSGDPSRIYGNLEANGRVFLINPNGVLVGKGATVNTRGFVASTLDVSDASFLSGARLTLSGDSTAAVVNEGAIEAIGGDVFLIGRTVENSGSIRAASGTAGLAAGSEVVIVPTGRERVSVIAGNADGAPAGTGVKNIGTIEAVSAELKAAGGNIYALAINNGGIVRATGVRREGGRVILTSEGGNIENSGILSAQNANGSGGTIVVAGGHNAGNPATVINSGTIQARGDAGGTRGGRVVLTGDHVGLFGSGLIDVSGHSGGGIAQVGGGYQGSVSSIQNADRTFIGQDAVIKADATARGDGGRVIVWANGVTRFYGTISARGGAEGGNGGFAEVSGKGSLEYRGSTDLGSPLGRVGSLLLDPKFIVIANGGAAAVGANDQFAENAAGTSTISPGDLVTALNTADVTLQANTDITFANDVDASGNATINDLTLEAGRSIILNANVNLNLPGAFTATFNSGAADAVNRDAGAAVFSMGASSTLIARGGVTIQAGTLADQSDGLGGVTTVGVDVNTGNIQLASVSAAGAPAPNDTAGNDAGNITILNNVATGKNISATGTIDARGSNGNNPGDHNGGNGGTVNIAASGTLALQRVTSSGGNDTGTAAGGNAGTVTLTAGGNITLGAPVTAVGGTGNTAGNGAGVSITSGGVLTVTETGGEVDVDAQNANVSLTALSLILQGEVRGQGAGGISFIADNIDIQSSVSLIDAGTATVAFRPLTAGTAIQIGAGATDAAASGPTPATLGLTGAELGEVTSAGSITIGNGTSGDLTVLNDFDFGARDITIQSGGDITFNLVAVNDAARLETSGDFVLLSGGAIDNQGGGVNIKADTLSATAQTGIDLDTEITTLTLAQVLGTGAIDISNTGDLDLNQVDTTGNGTFTATGNITDSGTLTIGGDATFVTLNDTPKNITLDEAGSTFGTLTARTRNTDDDANEAGIINIFESGDTDLKQVQTAGNATFTSTGNITDSGTLTIGGDATFVTRNDTPKNITLDQAASTFGTLSARTRDGANTANVAGTIDIFENNDTNLKLVDTTANATFTSAGNITDSGTLTIGGDATFLTRNDTAKNITLNDASSTFGTLTARTRNGADSANVAGAIDIFENNDTDLKLVDTTADATFTSVGNITDSGTLTIGGDATFLTRNDTAKNITLDQAASTFGTLTARTRNGADNANVAGTIDIIENNDTDLKLVDTTANATFTSAGNITDSGTLTIGGDATFVTQNDTPKNITLDETTSTFGTLTARTRNGANNANVAGTIDIFEDNDTDLKLVDTTGNATFTSTGNITDSGTLTIGGDAAFVTLNNTPKNITLDQAASTFGTLTARTRNGANDANEAGAIDVFENNDTDLKLVDTTGNATFTSTGEITDSGTLTIGGDATFLTRNDAPKNITLNDASSTFGTLTVRTRNGADNANVAGAIDIFENNDTDLKLVDTTGNGTFTSTGNITDSGTLTIGGDATFVTRNNTAKSITLNDVASTFGALTARTRNGADNANVAGTIDIFDNNDTDLKLVDTAGNATFTSTGEITDSGTLTIGGDATFVTRNDTPKNITLNDAASTFGTLTVRTRNAADNANVAGTIDIFENNDTDLKLVDTTGNGTFISTGNITDSGTLTIGGDATFVTRNNTAKSITLDQAASTFGTLTARTRNGADSANAAGTIDISENNDTHLKLIETAGSATLTSAGAIVDANGGSVNVIADSLSATAQSGVDLDTTITTLTLARSLGAGSVNVADTDGLIVNSALTDAGDITLSAAGDLTVTTATAGTGTPAASGNGNIQITATGAGSDVAVGNVTAAGDSITVNSGANVTDSQTDGAADLTADTIAVTAGGDIGTAANPLGVGGAVGNVDLTASSGAVHVNAQSAGSQNVNIKSSTGVSEIQTIFEQGGRQYIAKYAASALGDFTLQSGGNITEDAGFAVAAPVGTLTLRAVGSIGGDFATPLAINAGTFEGSAGTGLFVEDGGDLTLGSVSTAGGGFLVRAGDTLTLNNGTALSAGAGNVILVADGAPGISVSGAGTLNSRITSRFLIYAVNATLTDPPVIRNNQGRPTIGVLEADELDSPRNFNPATPDPFGDTSDYFVFRVEANPPTDPSLFIDIPMELYRPVSINFGEYDPTKFGEVGDLWMSSSELYEMERKAGKAPKAVPEKLDKSKYVAESK